jgi:hypothetical protein
MTAYSNALFNECASKGHYMTTLTADTCIYKTQRRSQIFW